MRIGLLIGQDRKIVRFEGYIPGLFSRMTFTYLPWKSTLKVFVVRIVQLLLSTKNMNNIENRT
jgi:hypothetical protein